MNESFIYQSIRLFKRRLLEPKLDKDKFSIKKYYEIYIYSPKAGFCKVFCQI